MEASVAYHSEQRVITTIQFIYPYNLKPGVGANELSVSTGRTTIQAGPQEK
jgi:hypothetical protein